MRGVATTAAGAVAASLGWWAAGIALAAREPWDSPRYPSALLIAILLGAVAGYVAPARPWRWGAVAILGQLPVMLARSAPGPLIAVGLLVLAVECVPAVAAACAAACLRHRRG